MNIKINSKIGTLKNDQISIQENIDKVFIDEIIFKNEKYLEELLNDEKNKYFYSILKDSFKNKEIPFPLTKQVELYLKKHKDNLSLVFRYLAFRLKFYLSSSQLLKIDHPPYLLIEPVSTCNLRCPFCYQTDLSFTKKPYMGTMDFELFKKVIDEADDIGVGAVTIGSRGEPSLHKQICDFINYLGDKKNIFEKKFITNATKLNEQLAETLLEKNINIIQISADHFIKKDYEELRLKSNFEEIVKNVDHLFESRKSRYPNSISEIRVSGVDARKNLDRAAFKDFWIKRSDHVSAGYPVERWDTYLNEPHPDLNTPCQQLWDRMYIWFDGKTNPCDADYKSYLSFGNVKNDTIKNVWNSHKINTLRNDHLNKKRKKVVPCDRCGVDFEN